jgi:ribonucleoside-diphosphate reductase alpha chain
LPIYKKYFVETNSIAPSVNVAPNLNKENMRYYKEYTNMKMPDVIDMIAVIQKWIDQSISFEWMINPADTSPSDLYGYYLKAWKQ